MAVCEAEGAGLCEKKMKLVGRYSLHGAIPRRKATENNRDMNIELQPIGTIHSPFKSKAGMPIQPSGARGIRGSVRVNEELTEGLSDLDGFSHIYLIYWFHQSKGYDLRPTPFLDKSPRGVFATRAPKRPNAIGLSVVRLLRVEKNILYIENVDILDGTPLLDIKPYFPGFDRHETDKNGWLEKQSQPLDAVKSDRRFE